MKVTYNMRRRELHFSLSLV